MQTLEISHDYFLRMIDKLVKQIEKNKEHCLMGIPAGGLVPAVYLHKRLDIPLVTFSTEGWFPPTSSIILVDDCVDTGKTIGVWPWRQLLEDGANLAVLAKKTWTPGWAAPDFCAETHSCWLKWPWEIKGAP